MFSKQISLLKKKNNQNTDKQTTPQHLGADITHRKESGREARCNSTDFARCYNVCQPFYYLGECFKLLLERKTQTFSALLHTPQLRGLPVLSKQVDNDVKVPSMERCSFNLMGTTYIMSTCTAAFTPPCTPPISLHHFHSQTSYRAQMMGSTRPTAYRATCLHSQMGKQQGYWYFPEQLTCLLVENNRSNSKAQFKSAANKHTYSNFAVTLVTSCNSNRVRETLFSCKNQRLHISEIDPLYCCICI